MATMKAEEMNAASGQPNNNWQTTAAPEFTNLTNECLPVIGESQVDSILSTLDARENGNEDSEDGLRLVLCEMCPFVCLEDAKLEAHVEGVHRGNAELKKVILQCPVCSSAFHHNLSLRAHLQYDHRMDDVEDLEKIMQAHMDGVVISKQVGLRAVAAEKPIELEFVNVEEEPHAPDSKVEVAEQMVVMATSTAASKAKAAAKLKALITGGGNRCGEPKCKVNLKYVENVEYHRRCHKGAAYECPECGESFALWKGVASHLWRLHKIDMELHCCDQCDYRTYSLGKLNRTHKLTHGTSKNFKCASCEKSFKNAKQLKNHQVIHKRSTAIPKFTCSDCLKLFNSRPQLKLHCNVVHKKLKPFLCSYCGYKSAIKSALRMHIRRHTGEKPYTCDICDYSSTDHNSLRRHKLRHSNEKPYKCSHCDYQCIQSSAYKVHVKTKHPGLEQDVLFSCPVCQFQSINREVYKCHMTSQHGQTITDPIAPQPTATISNNNPSS